MTMHPMYSTGRRCSDTIGFSTLVLLLTLGGTAPSATAAEAAAGDSAGDAIVLSPFEVNAANDRGYYGANTMSGTRLNSRLEDLAASMTVVTKEQMSDFAMLDINDIFNYEAGTEGIGNFTDVTFNANGDPVDNTQLDPNNANRVRGLAPANISFGNFSTSGRVPIDPINVDAVEISRGPNSNIFGLGNASGTVNMVPSTANLVRDRSQVQFRADSYDGHRSSIDLNRVLKKNVLAVRGSAVYQHDESVRKPSGTNTVRLNGMIKFQPFKSTTLTASHSIYRMSGNRANLMPPRDAITFWRESGSPSWDPLTQTVYINGEAVGVYPGGPNGVTNAPYFTNALIVNNGGGSSLFSIDRDGSVTLWTPGMGTSTDSPLSQDQRPYRYVTTNPPNFRTTQPLFQTALPVTDKGIYDWSEINLAAMNYQAERTATTTIQLEHFFLQSDRQLLGLQASWYREDSDAYRRLILAVPSSTGTNSSRANSGYLYVDPNIRLLDGRPNPNYLRPNIGISSPGSNFNPFRNDTYRGQLAYRLDLRREKNLLRWLGMHQMSAYTEYQERQSRRYSYNDAIVSDHAWLPPGTPRANRTRVGNEPYNGVSATATRVYAQYYLGDNIGQNVDYAPGQMQYGVYPFSWGNAITGEFHYEPAEIDQGADLASTGGNANVWTVLKTHGAVLQSHFLKGRIVTTVGAREDTIFTKRGAEPSLLPDAKTHDFEAFNQWQPDWQMRSGRTKTAGVVVKPLKWLNLHLNRSDSFRPEPPAQNIYLQPLPNPEGIGKDYGFSLNLFDGKLNVRVNRYETKQINSRNGGSASFAINARRLDIYDMSPSRAFGLNYRSRNWIANAAAAQGQTLTEEELDQRVADLMGFTVPQLKALEDLSLPIAAIDNVISKGAELELNYNPNNYWTLKFNATKSETLTSAIAPDIVQWLEERTPIWQSIIDTDTGLPWYTSRYNPATNGTAENYRAANIDSQLKLVLQQVGKARPQIRKYRANLSTSYRLAGLTDHRIMSKFNVGGGVRWEDKGAIGYYGVQQLPEVITELDASRPIWSKANWYFDAFISYRTRILRDKIGTTVQLNVRNLQESHARLQPVSAFPDGTPNAYRIIDPRQFILTVTFDL